MTMQPAKVPRFHFPPWSNKLPAVSVVAITIVAIAAIFLLWYYGSPKHTDFGDAPAQTVPYSHKLHAGNLGMDCRYCHRMVEDGPAATVPDSDTCFGCHKEVKKDSVLSEPLRTAFGDGLTTDTPIEWVKVHLLPEFLALAGGGPA